MVRYRAFAATCVLSVALTAACSSSSKSSAGSTSSAPAPAATTSAASAAATSAPAAVASSSPPASVASSSAPAAAVSGSAAAYCGSGTVKTIGYSPVTLQTGFFVDFGNALKAAAAKCGIKMVEADPGGDAAKQTSDIENMLNAGVSAIGVTPQDPTAMSAAVAAANTAKVPLVGLFGSFTGQAATVGPDDAQLGASIGQQAGLALQKLKPGKASYNIVILNNDSLGTEVITRRTSMEAAFAKIIPNYKIVANVAALTEADGNKAMSTILQKGKDIDAVLSTNDSSSLGAISALQSAGLKAGTDLVVAISGDTQRDLQSIINGQTPGGPYADYAVWATGALTAMLKLAAGQTLTAADSALPLSLVTSANAQQLYNQLYGKS
jgi:ABC-type sugar transport system substrate-binding protein